VRLDELGEPLVPPYPCIEELVWDIGDAKDIVGRPLMFMQVSSSILKCCNHNRCCFPIVGVLTGS
jgi:hypothetical protein